MKICCEKSILYDALSRVVRVVPTRTTLTALEGVLLEAGDNLRMTGYNLEVGIVSSIDAEIKKPGAVIAGARLLCDIVRRLPDLPVTLELVGEQTLCVTCGQAEYKISSCLPAENFPELPAVTGDAFCRLPQGLLKDMLARTLFSVSDNENKIIQTGALFRFEEERLTVAAVDGYRLALRREAVKCASPQEIVVPGTALREVERLLEDVEDRDVALIQNGQQLSFSMGDVILITRLLSGKFLNFENSVTQTRPVSLKIDCEALRQSVERVSLLINEKIKSPVRLLLAPDQVTVSCVTMLGQATDVCPAALTGAASLEIGFNHRYMLDALRALPREDSHMEFNNPLSPCVIVPDEGEAFLFMILPVRLHADGN